MLRFLFGLVLLAALAGAVAFVPVRGRTVLDRWNAAHGAGEFVERGYREVRVALGLEQETPRPARAQAARPSRPAARLPARPQRPPAPAEQHTEQDRAALDRIVAEHAR